MTLGHWYILIAALSSFAFGWAVGYRQGRYVGFAIGRELERRKQKRDLMEAAKKGQP